MYSKWQPNVYISSQLSESKEEGTPLVYLMSSTQMVIVPMVMVMVMTATVTAEEIIYLRNIPVISWYDSLNLMVLHGKWFNGA